MTKERSIQLYAGLVIGISSLSLAAPSIGSARDEYDCNGGVCTNAAVCPTLATQNQKCAELCGPGQVSRDDCGTTAGNEGCPPPGKPTLTLGWNCYSID